MAEIRLSAAGKSFKQFPLSESNWNIWENPSPTPSPASTSSDEQLHYYENYLETLGELIQTPKPVIDPLFVISKLLRSLLARCKTPWESIRGICSDLRYFVSGRIPDYVHLTSLIPNLMDISFLRKSGTLNENDFIRCMVVLYDEPLSKLLEILTLLRQEPHVIIKRSSDSMKLCSNFCDSTRAVWLQILNFFCSYRANYPYYVQQLSTLLKTRKKSKTYLDLETGCEIPPGRTSTKLYQSESLLICCNSLFLYNQALVTLPEVKGEYLVLLVECIRTYRPSGPGESREYIDPSRPMGTGVRFQEKPYFSTRYKFISKEYRLATNSEEIFHRYMYVLTGAPEHTSGMGGELNQEEKILQKRFSQVLLRTREAELMEMIKNGIKETGYINLDTYRNNKTASRKEGMQVQEEYGFMSTNPAKFEHYCQLVSQLRPPLPKRVVEPKEKKEKRKSSTTSSSSSSSLLELTKEKPKTKSKKRKQTISKILRTRIWKRDFGTQGEGICCLCGDTLSVHDFEAGHIQAEANGGKVEPNNLVPIHGVCNRSMGTANMADYMREHGLGELKISLE